jgi:hypothetical protein
MVVGTQISSRVARKVDARALIAVGFTLLAAAMFVGTATGPGTAYGFTAAWMAIAGAGLGFTLPAAMDASLGVLEPARAGTGSALIMAMRQVGGAIGVAILGTVLNSVYRANLDVAGLPGAAAAAARRSVTAGAEVAHQSGSAALLASVRSSFSDALSTALTVSGVIAAVGVPGALWLMPRRGRVAVPGALSGEASGAASGDAGREVEDTLPRTAESIHEQPLAFE